MGVVRLLTSEVPLQIASSSLNEEIQDADSVHGVFFVKKTDSAVSLDGRPIRQNCRQLGDVLC